MHTTKTHPFWRSMTISTTWRCLDAGSITVNRLSNVLRRQVYMRYTSAGRMTMCLWWTSFTVYLSCLSFLDMLWRTYAARLTPIRFTLLSFSNLPHAYVKQQWLDRRSVGPDWLSVRDSPSSVSRGMTWGDSDCVILKSMCNYYVIHI